MRMKWFLTMLVPITLTDLGTDQATVSLWFVQPGETVFVGDRIVEILIPGATFDVAAPHSGTLLERLALPGDRVQTGQILGALDPNSDD